MERGQVVERGRVLTLFSALDPCYMHLTRANTREYVGLSFLSDSVAGKRNTAAVECDGVESFGLEILNLALALDEQRERRRHHAPHVERAMVNQRHKPRGVHTNKPVCFRPAQRGGIEVVIFSTRAQICIRFAYLVRLHRTEP